MSGARGRGARAGEGPPTATERVVFWGFVIAVGAVLVPVLAVVALVLGALAAGRGRVGSGVAIMVIGLVLGVTSWTVAFNGLLGGDEPVAPLEVDSDGDGAPDEVDFAPLNPAVY